MDKTRANEVITLYMEKIFGFALTKTYDTDRASELASRITFAVYTSLLKADEVFNLDGYVYRIAQNVYARFVDEEVRGRYVSLDNVNIAAADDFTLSIEKDEIYRQLRRQVSFLGKTRREVVVMFYFDRLKQSEIAKRLNLPTGTIKWHLHEAKNQLKGGLEMNPQTNLDLSPIRLTSLSHSGNPAPNGKSTEHYLAKLIAQNIMYATYWQARTIPEIAEAIGVSAAFIEDEVTHLEEYGFLDKLSSGKYQANIFIQNFTKEIMEQKHALLDLSDNRKVW